MVQFVNGSDLPAALQREALARYVHRYTRDHVPAWARDLRAGDMPYPVQFASDSEWLANSVFPVTARGKLASRPGSCQSNPTWPDGK